MLKKIFIVLLLVLFGVATFNYLNHRLQKRESDKLTDNPGQINDSGEMRADLDPLTIESLRQGQYPRSEITIEQTLEPGSNFSRYIASYRSEGLKIYALLTIPDPSADPGQAKPEKGWPVIIFNHGFIPPAEYKTTERYVAYTDGFSRNGYIVFRPDYRGHGNSEGEAEGAYGSNAYTIDVLNAVTSIKKLTSLNTDNRQPITNPDRIGMWGHSLGGFITLRSMVVDKSIKAGVIWAGVVGSYPDLLNRWRRNSSQPSQPGIRPGWRRSLVEKYGTPEANPDFWNSISANSYLQDISGPLQLHHGTADTSVPIEFSETLEKQMQAAGKTVELYIYPSNDHNLSQSFNLAMQRSVEFFDKYSKEK